MQRAPLKTLFPKFHMQPSVSGAGQSKGENKPQPRAATVAAADAETERKARGGWWAQAEKIRDQRLAWWRDARFRAFIHCGTYSNPAGEWQRLPAPIAQTRSATDLAAVELGRITRATARPEPLTSRIDGARKDSAFLFELPIDRPRSQAATCSLRKKMKLRTLSCPSCSYVVAMVSTIAYPSISTFP